MVNPFGARESLKVQGECPWEISFTKIQPVSLCIAANGMARNCRPCHFCSFDLSYLYSSGLSIISMGRNRPVPRERLSASAATQAA